MRELTRQLSDRKSGPVPILIDLGTLQLAMSFNQLIARHLTDFGEERIDVDRFRYMVETGEFALLFDGLDQLAQHVGEQSAMDHFGTTLEAAAGKAKVVAAIRTQHFDSIP